MKKKKKIKNFFYDSLEFNKLGQNNKDFFILNVSEKIELSELKDFFNNFNT